MEMQEIQKLVEGEIVQDATSGVKFKVIDVDSDSETVPVKLRILEDPEVPISTSFSEARRETFATKDDEVWVYFSIQNAFENEAISKAKADEILRNRRLLTCADLVKALEIPDARKIETLEFKRAKDVRGITDDYHSRKSRLIARIDEASKDGHYSLRLSKDELDSFTSELENLGYQVEDNYLFW